MSVNHSAPHFPKKFSWIVKGPVKQNEAFVMIPVSHSLYENTSELGYILHSVILSSLEAPLDCLKEHHLKLTWMSI